MKLKPIIGYILDTTIVCPNCFKEEDRDNITNTIHKGDSMDGQQIFCGLCGSVIVDNVERP